MENKKSIIIGLSIIIVIAGLSSFYYATKSLESNLSISQNIASTTTIKTNKSEITINESNIDSRISITSPAGGEIWNINSTYPITWKIKNIPADYWVHLSFSRVPGVGIPIQRASKMSTSVTSYNWKIPHFVASSDLMTPLKEGKYYVTVSLYTGENSPCFGSFEGDDRPCISNPPKLIMSKSSNAFSVIE